LDKKKNFSVGYDIFLVNNIIIYSERIVIRMMLNFRQFEGLLDPIDYYRKRFYVFIWA